MPNDHEIPDGAAPAAVKPLVGVEPAPRAGAAEQARTLLAANPVSTLATLSEDGKPWASLVAHGALEDGSPVLFISTLAEHARNLERNPAASLMVADPEPPRDPLACGRVTLAGTAEQPSDAATDEAWEAYIAAVPSAKAYSTYRDFSLWVLKVERVRWVGGFGRMAWAKPDVYAEARPDRVSAGASHAIAHLNADHPDALLGMVRVLGGHPDATEATCAAIDRLGIDLEAVTPRGPAFARLAFVTPAEVPADLRAATVQLARRARGE